jgi:hypothetical protein
MTAFELYFRDGEVRGHGRDLIGRFTFHGDFDPKTGQLRLVKQYLGKHQVLYDGKPDGEGCICGSWLVETEVFGKVYSDRGPFWLRPELPRPTGDEPIVEIRR